MFAYHKKINKNSEKPEKHRPQMTEGNILKGFILFAIPLFLGSLFQQLYGTVDLLFVGNILGKNDAAAVGSSSILVTCLIGLFTGISVGAGVVTAQYWGAKDTDNVTHSIENSLFIGLIGGMILTGIGEALCALALHWLSVPETIMDHAVCYLRIYLLSILPMIMYNMSAAILRAIGDSKTPFLVLASGGILNVCMDALFIGFLDMGVAGAAFATMVSQLFTAIVLTVFLVRREKLLGNKWKINVNLITKVITVGVPLGIQSMILTLSNLVVQYYINGFGENDIAAFTIYFKVENLIYLPIMAFGQAMVTFVGQNIGAGKVDRIKKAALECNFFSAVVIGVLSGILLLSGRGILKLFCSDEEVIAEGLKIIHISFPFYFICAILEVTGSILRGAGKTLQSMVIVIVSLCGFRIIILKALIIRSHTIQAVATVYPLSWFCAAVLFVGCWMYYKNKMDFYGTF